MLNHTYIALIPNKFHRTTVVDFRLISFCNVLYKLISKVIANRLKPILPALISDSQSAFVLKRHITNNILVAYEVFHFLRRKKKGNQGFMSLKIDMSKAYD